MTKSLDPFRFRLIAVSGWMNQQQLQFIDSTGLRSVLAVLEGCRDRGQQFAVTRGSQQVQRLLGVTGVAKHLRIIDAADEVLA